MREAAALAPAGLAWIDLDRWTWSPAFQGAGRPVAAALVVGVALLAVGCLVWRAGSGPATHAERRAARSGWRWVHTVLALLFPPLLAAGAWLIVLPSPEPVKLVLISRAVRAELFDEAKWTNAAGVAAASSPDRAEHRAAPLDVGPVVDDVLRGLSELPKLPTRDELESHGPVADQVRDILVQAVLARADLDGLHVRADHQVAALKPSKHVHAIPSWLVESVELGCLRLLVERTNVQGVLVGTAGRLDRFGQETYVDAPGYLAGRGSLDTKEIRAEVASKSETAITLIGASPWPGGKVLLLFRVPPTPIAIAQVVGLRAKSKDGSWAGLENQSFKSGPRVQLISTIITAPADAVVIEAKAPDGTVTQAVLSSPPSSVKVLVGPGTAPSPPSDPNDRSYLYRVMEDLKTRGPVSFVDSASDERFVRLDQDPSGVGVWLYFDGAVFDRALTGRGSDAKVREFELREISAPSMLSVGSPGTELEFAL